MNLYIGTWPADGGLVEHEIERVDEPTLTRIIRDQPIPDPTDLILTLATRMLAITIDADRVMVSYQREPGADHFLLGDATALAAALELLHTHTINTTPPHWEPNP